MAIEDGRRDYATFDACLPLGKKVTNLGYTYPELCCLGGWYIAPVPGSNRRSYYNRWYINPPKGNIVSKDMTAFIQCGKTNFGKLIIKQKTQGWGQEWDKEKTEFETQRWMFYIKEMTECLHKCWIVLVPEGRSDSGVMFSSFEAAKEYADSEYVKLSRHMRLKYGVEVYKPQSTTPLYGKGGIFNV